MRFGIDFGTTHTVVALVDRGIIVLDFNLDRRCERAEIVDAKRAGVLDDLPLHLLTEAREQPRLDRRCKVG